MAKITYVETRVFKRISRKLKNTIDMKREIVYRAWKFKGGFSMKKVVQIPFPRFGFRYPRHGSAYLRQSIKE
jgi:hypothetical protein